MFAGYLLLRYFQGLPIKISYFRNNTNNNSQKVGIGRGRLCIVMLVFFFAIENSIFYI